MRKQLVEKVRKILCEYEGANYDKPDAYLELAEYIIEEIGILKQTK